MPNGAVGGLNGFGGYPNPVQINNTQFLQGNTQMNTHLNTQVNQNNTQMNPHHTLNIQTHPSVTQVHNTVSGQ